MHTNNLPPPPPTHTHTHYILLSMQVGNSHTRQLCQLFNGTNTHNLHEQVEKVKGQLLAATLIKLTSEKSSDTHNGIGVPQYLSKYTYTFIAMTTE